MLTKKQYDKLKPFEHIFRCAKQNYIRGVYSRDIELLSNVYYELGQHLSNKNCGSCVLNMCRYLANEYYDYVNKKQKDE